MTVTDFSVNSLNDAVTMSGTSVQKKDLPFKGYNFQEQNGSTTGIAIYAKSDPNCEFPIWQGDYTAMTVSSVAPSDQADALAKLRAVFFLDNGGFATNPNSGTDSNLSTLITAQTAPLGYYLITDVADAGLLALVSQDANGVQFVETQAFGYFMNANYAGSNLGPSFKGIWVTAETGYLNSNIVIYATNMYSVKNTLGLNGTNPTVNTGAYTLLAKTVANGYVESLDRVDYDFVNNV